MNSLMSNKMTRQPLTEPRSERLDADDILQLLRRNLGLIALIVAITLGLTALYLSRQSDRYTARAEMALTTSELRLSQINSQLESYDLTNSRVSTELDVLRSRSFAALVATEQGLYDDPDFLPPPENGTPLTPEARKRAVVDLLLASYSLHRTGDSLVIDILADAPTAELASRIANGVVSSFIDLSVSDQSQSIDGSINYLRGQVASLGEELSQKEVDLANFIREYALDDKEQPGRLRRERSHMTSVLEVMDSEGTGQSAEALRIRGQLEEVEAQLAERTRNDLTLSRKQRYVALLATRYQTAIERLNELEPRKQMIKPDARQISAAEVPMKPSWPNRGVTLVLTGVAALVLGFVAALLRESLSRKVWDGQQATRVSELPNMGTLPRIRRKSLVAGDHNPIWFIRTFPRSAFAEALRALLTVWSSQKRDESATPVLMITSALAGEGKSTVSTGLASSAAEDGLRVLLMDFDTHRGGAARILELEAPGVPAAEVAKGGKELDAAIRHVPDFDSFDMIAFADPTHWKPALVKSFREAVIPRLRERYDLIIMDTPPALAVSDAVRFASISDETLVVLRSGRTTERALRNTVERLASCGLQISGTVVNAVEPRRYRQQNQGDGYGYY